MENKKQKILIFSPYYPPHVGGVENYTKDLCLHLATKNITITIFTPHIPESASSEEIFKNIRIVRFPAFEIITNYPMPKFWLPKFWSLYHKLFVEQHFDIVISQTRFFFTSLLALAYVKIKKNRWLHIEHGSSFVQSGNFLISFFAKLYDNIFGKIILKKADNIIAISYAVKKFVEELAPKTKCTVLYRGFDFDELEKIKPNITLKQKYNDKKIVTYIGRLISGKGVADLLNAFAQLENKDTILFLVGNGPEKNNLENLTKKIKIDDRVIFFGQMSHEETISLLKISDIFVNPSYSEGLPTTVIEAAVCKKAIIATNTGGTNEIILKKCGFLISPRDIKNLSEKMQYFIKNQEKGAIFGENAYFFVKERFNWNSILKFITYQINE